MYLALWWKFYHNGKCNELNMKRGLVCRECVGSVGCSAVLKTTWNAKICLHRSKEINSWTVTKKKQKVKENRAVCVPSSALLRCHLNPVAPPCSLVESQERWFACVSRDSRAGESGGKRQVSKPQRLPFCRLEPPYQFHKLRMLMCATLAQKFTWIPRAALNVRVYFITAGGEERIKKKKKMATGAGYESYFRGQVQVSEDEAPLMLSYVRCYTILLHVCSPSVVWHRSRWQRVSGRAGRRSGLGE